MLEERLKELIKKFELKDEKAIMDFTITRYNCIFF